MVNENFDEFIKTETKHKSKYVNSTQEPYKIDDEKTNTRSDTDMSVGAKGRDIFKEKNE
ncbi:hypothetical protein [Metabacillus litoralis]|uniref:hypothetical protein n=1 Tax=Metabacillus litoralis TaxID=152268 RepID=UPI001315A4DB|nr:hypothetical protein [Metabacillus litoralis]